MDGINCVNLLAFIQIAVVFNFGLFYLKENNSLTNLHKKFQNDLRLITQSTIDNAVDVMNQANATNDEDCKNRSAILGQYVDKLNYLTDKGSKWDEYAFLGLYAGVYGILCLLIIGINGCCFDVFNQSFLLIVAEIFMVIQIFIFVKITLQEEAHIVSHNAYRNIIYIILILIISALFAYFDWTYELNFGFKALFTISLVAVYFPIFAFLGNAMYEYLRVRYLSSDCEDEIEIICPMIKRAQKDVEPDQK